MARDPLCGMEVDQSKTPYKIAYKGAIYYFCSNQCKEKFGKNPEYHLKHGLVEMHHINDNLKHIRC